MEVRNGTRQELEHHHLLQVLQNNGWRIEEINGAEVLFGLNTSTLRTRMRKYGIRLHSRED
jgi:transcriptional regulator with GAF, ATPase, and Fis domain